MIRHRLTFCLFLCLTWVFTCAANLTNLIQHARTLRERGEFRQAEAFLTQAIRDKSSGLTTAEQKHLAYEIDLLQRIRLDYSLTEETLFKRLNESLTGLTRAEFMEWLKAGRFDSRKIDGTNQFIGVSVSNLYFRHPELNARRKKPKDDASYQQALLANARAIRAAALRETRPYVLPQNYQMTMTVTVNSNAVPAGETVRAWLPIPRAYPFQGSFKILDSSPTLVTPPDEAHSSIRSVHLSARAETNNPTEFNLTYQYRSFGVHFAMQPEQVDSRSKFSPGEQPFLQEAPHVVFTDSIKQLAHKIAGNETNHLKQAKAFFDWIAGNIQYSFALEYSTIPNISEYCLTKGYGDCGQEALLFITLCRSRGIPARWQSGWFTWPGHETIHDWAEVYLAPYGWVPLDPYMGIYAMRYATALAEAERQELRDFYFGGLDQYRMIANSDHNQSLSPAKNSWRSDDVDFQRGELEYGTNNLYFDQYDYDLQVQLLPEVK